MPAVAIAVASAGLAAGTVYAVGIPALGIAAGSMTAALVVGAGSLVLSAASGAFSKPKMPDMGGLNDFAAMSRDRTVSVRQPITPWRVIYGQVRVGGVYTFLHTTDNNRYLHIVLTMAGHEVEEIGDIYFNDEIVPLDGSGNATGKYAGKVRIKKATGATTQAAYTDLVSEASDKWTANHRQRGKASVYVRLEFDQDLFPNGVPNVTAVIKGRKVYDPRTGLTAWSANPALCLNDYLTDSTIGLGAVYASEIDATTLTAAANACDENVTLAAGGTEDRYTVNGEFSTGDKPQRVIENLLSAMAGQAVFTGGKWYIHAGVYTSPTITLSEADARAPLRITTRVSRRENFNAVKGVCVSPDNNWQPSDFPPITNATYLSEDNSERVWRDIELPFTTSMATAQRLAKIQLEKARQQITVSLPCKLTAYRVKAGDTVSLTNTRMGWSAKAFDVIESRLTIDTADGAPALGVDLILRETASTVYDWSSSEETIVDAAPDTDLPDPFTVQPPGALTVTEELYVTRSGDGVKTKANLSWLASIDAFAARYEVQYKLTSATDYTVAGETAALAFEVFDLTPGSYTFRVRAINQLAVRSSYSTTAQNISGLLAAPTAPQNMTISSVSSLAILRWDRSPDVDVRIGGKIEFRHSPGSTLWAESTSIGEAVAGSETVAVLPLKAGNYLARAVDSSGVYSAATSSVNTAAATALTFSSLSTVTEDSAFSGAKSSVSVVSSSLRLTGAGLFDAITSLDGVSDVDLFGGVASSGTYDFASGIDLGSQKRTRARSSVTATVVNALDQVDSRTGNVDEWQDFDGNAAASADARVYVRETNDDPAGSPSWSAWNRLDVAEFNARAFQFQARLTSADVAYNIHVSALGATVEEVA